MKPSAEMTPEVRGIRRPKTSPPTDVERDIMGQFEPLAEDRAEAMSSFIVSGAVEIARYRRSIAEHPDMTEHYQRLERCVRTALAVRFADYVATQPITGIEALEQAVAGIAWPQTPKHVVPIIVKSQEADQEAPYVLRLQEQSFGVPAHAVPVGVHAQQIEARENAAWARMHGLEMGA